MPVLHRRELPGAVRAYGPAPAWLLNSSSPRQGTQWSGPRQSPGRGNCDFAPVQTKNRAIGRLFELGSRSNPPRFALGHSLRSGGTDTRTAATGQGRPAAQARRRGIRDRFGRSPAGSRRALSILRRTCAARREHYTLRTRPIVAAVHSALPATYGTPGRTGSVRAERPSQGSGFPCAILAGRASRAVALSAGAALSSSEPPLRSRRLGFR